MEEHDAAYNGWKDLNSAPAIDLPLNFFEHLRECYPSHHVVQTDAGQCDLIGYANAGYAEARRDETEAAWSIRIYEAPGSRLANEPKTVQDRVNFARWIYIWEEKEHIVYRVRYEHPRRIEALTLQFILAYKEPSVDVNDLVEAIDSLILAVGAWSSEIHDEIHVFDNQGWVKDRDLYESVKGSSWDEVILNQTMKKNLITDVQGFFDNQDLYKRLAVPWKRGIILHGVPGNGKTISIKALINSLSRRPNPIPSLYVKSFDGEYHDPKWSINTIFQHARIMAPCLLIFEDLDSLVTEKTRSYFLNEVDGLESNEGILMIGSTNHLGRLDPAISKRPSRFDRKYMFRMPIEEERRAYAEFWRKKLVGSDMVDFDEGLCPIVAQLTEGFSFAYLKELFVITLLGIARGVTEAGDDEITSEGGISTSTSTSTDDGVLIEKEDTVDGSKESQPASSSEESGPAKQPESYKSLPKVDIPEHFKDNVLLRALISQAKMLVDEMDNTDELVVAEKVPGPN